MKPRPPSEIRRLAMLGLGWLLIVTAPLTAPLPGPGATIMFLGGVALLLRNSEWAKRQYVRFKRRWPKLGHYADRGMRRPSVARRIARDEGEVAAGTAAADELTFDAPSPNGTADTAVEQAAILRSEIRELRNEADLSAVEPGARPPARLPQPHGDSGRPQRDSRPPQPWPQEAVGVTTLTLRRDFLAANKGKRAPMPGFVLLVHDRADGDPAMRVGFTVTKKIGNAVVRNRMKRRLRALSRELLPDSGIRGADHVLIGREGGIERDYAAMRAELTKALAKVAR